MSKKISNYEIGARKRSLARVSCRAGTGKVTINGLNLDAYEPEMARLMIREPMIIAGDTASKIDFSANVHGGGIIGQASAIRQAISKLLVGHEKTLKKKFFNGTLISKKQGQTN